MYGVAGKGKAEENAIDTAKVLNSVRSKAIALMNLTLIPGTKLYMDALNGVFVEANEEEKLREIRSLIANLDLEDDTALSSIHISNLAPLNGILPRDKESFLERLDRVIK